MSLPICTTHLIDAVGACPKCAEAALAAAQADVDRLGALAERLSGRNQDLRDLLDSERQAREAAEAEIARIRAGDKLAPMLDFIDIASSNRERADRADRVLLAVAEALRPAYGDDVHRCTTETWPKWVAEQVQRAEAAERALAEIEKHISDWKPDGGTLRWRDWILTIIRAARARAEGQPGQGE